MKNQFLVYTAGPITGCDYNGCTEWREWVKNNVDGQIATISPMRGKQFIKERSGYGIGVSPLASVKGINTRDYFDVQRCDAVFVNFRGASKISIGTVMEIAWARAFNKPVVCVMEKNNIHNHSMLNYACGYIVETLEEGVMVLEALLLTDAKIPQLA
jgi:nucleoside 2-deoxyribosyltransferase